MNKLFFSETIPRYHFNQLSVFDWNYLEFLWSQKWWSLQLFLFLSPLRFIQDNLLETALSTLFVHSWNSGWTSLARSKLVLWIVCLISRVYWARQVLLPLRTLLNFNHLLHFFPHWLSYLTVWIKRSVISSI